MRLYFVSFGSYLLSFAACVPCFTFHTPSPRGLYFGPKTIFIPPPLLKMLFVPLLWHIVFQLPLCPFCLNSSLFCNYFTLLLPLISFSFRFLPFSFPFLPFSFTFPSYFSSPFHIFSPKLHRLIFLLQRGDIFQYIDPCSPLLAVVIPPPISCRITHTPIQ